MFDTHSFVKDFVSAKKSDLKELELRLVKWFAAMLLAQGVFIVALITLLN